MGAVVVLGGCGGIGRVAVRTLAAGDWFDRIVVADLRESDAATLVGELGDGRLEATAVDAGDPASVGRVAREADVVVNCVGPFYRFGAPVLEAVIDAGVDYVDVCDDLDATERQLELGPRAESAGVRAVVGMGNSPGLANVLARFAADDLLEQVTGVDIMHVHGGEPEEGPGVIKHRIHAMVSDVPLFVDGEMHTVRLLEESGRAFVEDTDFRTVGTLPVFPYPHPETITLPVHLAGLERATNRGVIYPLAYFEHTMEVVRAGLEATPHPSEADIDGWVDDILAERPRLLAEAGVDRPGGCLKVVATGTGPDGEERYEFSMASADSGAGEGTGIPVALGAVLLADGRVSRAGVNPPEAVVAPADVIGLAAEVLPRLGIGGGSGEFPLVVEHVSADGTRVPVALPF